MCIRDRERPEQFLIILARPCHSPTLVDGTFNLPGDAERLYIGLERNYDIDLLTPIPGIKEAWDYEVIPHNGTSADGEQVLKILGCIQD